MSQGLAISNDIKKNTDCKILSYHTPIIPANISSQMPYLQE